MLGRQNTREQSFLIATVQNIKRLVKAFFRILCLGNTEGVLAQVNCTI